MKDFGLGLNKWKSFLLYVKRIYRIPIVKIRELYWVKGGVEKKWNGTVIFFCFSKTN